MAISLGTYPLKIKIVDSDGMMTPEFEKVFRGMYQAIQGAVKPVGLFSAQGNSVILPGNTLRVGSNVDIVAQSGSVALAETISVSVGGTQIAVETFNSAANVKGVFHITLNVTATFIWAVYIWADNGHHAGAGVGSMATPDLTKPLTIAIDADITNFISVRCFT